MMLIQEMRKNHPRNRARGRAEFRNLAKMEVQKRSLMAVAISKPCAWTVNNISELKEPIEKEEKHLESASIWPILLVDQDQLSVDSKDLAVLSALLSLSSNKAIRQNTGTTYELWLLVC
ncbi:hypothetical protein M407DRAFT_12628 [Tulasnella calospora MUT 4182]|uniref:Uncharacterized protein n=1 Tax=Tulasnella calospora MUT 4182 TaxID=1051891 RepID=A0A0C3K656_9AGAM|nr:hypothetical protein M407DRAFT_12628 [Tulasnella calospora MUT 4182]